MNKHLFRLLFGALFLVAATVFTGCKEDDSKSATPTLSVSTQSLVFTDATEKTQTVQITANCEWKVVTSSLDWATVEPMNGRGNGTISVTVQELPAGTNLREGKISFTLIHAEFGNWGTAEQSIAVSQVAGSDVPTGEIAYANNFDKEAATQTYGSGNSWPYTDQFEGWKNESGYGIADVTYTTSGISVRNNSNSNNNYSDYAGSGVNNLLFSSNSNFTIEKIAVNSVNLRLTFGTERYAYGEDDNTFNHDEFKVQLSNDGTNWSAPLTYTFAKGVDPNGRWDLASSDFSLPEGTTSLYIRFRSTLSGAHRLDDVTLLEGAGGQAITFDYAEPDDPGMDTSDAIYFNDMDKEVASQTDGKWPYADEFEGWKNQTGSGAANVTYTTSGVSVRSNSPSDAGYSDYAGSGNNNLLFGTNGVVTIEKIAVSEKNLALSFGTERYLYGASDNTFNHDEFKVELSNDGTNWSSPLTYTFAKGVDPNGRWDLATADFTLPDGVSTLYIRFSSTLSGAHRLDDVLLKAGNGGQQVSFDGGGDEPGPEPTDAIFTNNFDKQIATQTDGKWPYADQFDGWKNESGSGAGNVTYTTSGISVRNNSNSDSQYSDYAGSGANNLLFGTNGVLTIEKIAVSGKNLSLSFGAERYAYGQSDNTFKHDEFKVELSNNGTNWSSPLTYTFAKGVDPNGRWDLATADFTLPDGVSTLYIRFSSTLSGAHRLDDVLLKAGNGGQQVSFDGSGEEPGPSEAVKTTIPELIALCEAAGSEQQVIDESKDYYFEAVVVTDKEGGNTTSNNLQLMTEGATTAKNGITLYGSGVYTNPADEGFTFKAGDKVKVTLKAGEARVTTYNKLYEVTGSQGASWVVVEKIGTATVTPVEIAPNQITDFQAMPVSIKNVTAPATASTWNGTKTFTQNGVEVTVYTSQGAPWADQQFVAGATGTITGYAALYKGAAQVSPRNTKDIADFMSGTTPEPDPDVTPIGEITTAGTYKTEGTVVARGKMAYIIADNTGAMMVYHNGNERSVGEKISISGEVTLYNAQSTPQFSDSAVVEVLSTGNNWTYNPAQKDGAAMDALLSGTPVCTEIEFQGNLAISGNYVNVTIPGASTAIGSVKYIDNSTISQLNGKDVVVKGYFVGTSSGKYVNVLPYSIEEVGGSTEPDPDKTPIGEITTAGTYKTEGTVVARGKQAYIIADNTGAMMVYHNGNERSVGEKISISGEVTLYNAQSTPQFSASAEVEVLSTGNSWSYNPAQKDGAAMDALLSGTPVCTEIAFQGNLAVSGNYVNVTIPGASTAIGSIKYIDNSTVAAYDGRDVLVKGYFVGTSSNKYVNVLPYSVEETNPSTDPEMTVDPASLSFPAAGGEKSVTVTTRNADGCTIEASADNAKFSVSVSGTTVTVAAGENTSESAINATLTVKLMKSGSAVVTRTVALTQSGVSSGNDTKGTYTSMDIFTSTKDDSPSASYTLGNSTTFNGMEASGVKLGTSSKSGYFTSQTVGVTGSKKLSFYAVAWKGKSATLYVRVNGGGSVTSDGTALTANDGATGNPPFTITVSDSDYYTLDVTGLTASSTITFSTSPNFANESSSASRAVVAGIQLY